MIKSFACSETKTLFETGESRRFQSIERVALRKLDMIHAAVKITDLKVPPGNHLEKLLGDRLGQFSIRINNQWRICFRWEDTGVYDLEIVDYH